MKARSLFIILCLGLVLTQAKVNGSVIYVPDTYPTIQGAIDSSSAGDTIILRDGTYSGAGNRDLTYNGRAITVCSEHDDPAICVIDCGTVARGFIFNHGETADSMVRGLTIRNGRVTLGVFPANCGGGMYLEGASPSIINCSIRSNYTAHTGAGIFCITGAQPTISNCSFVSNIASSQGGAIGVASGSISVTDSQFVTNSTSSSFGGAVFINTLTSPASFHNCIMTDNEGSAGGGVYISSGSYSFTNCIIANNSAYAGSGGGATLQGSGTLLSCTFGNNTATGDGKALAHWAGTVTIKNCILWGPAANQLWSYAPSSLTVSYSDVYGGWTGVGNINWNPRFMSATDFHLRSYSPCIDAGTGNGVPSLDIDGDVRPQSVEVDMGADEVLGYVSPCGLVVPDDYPTIQAAITAAAHGEDICLLDGTYSGTGNKNLNFSGKALTLRSYSNNPEACIIDCGNSGRAFIFNHAETADAVIRGITVRNGRITTGEFPTNCGGGFFIDAAFPTIRDCIISNNYSSHTGGGLFSDNLANPTIINCSFINNSAASQGGAIGADYSSVTIVDSIISGNKTTAWAGGGVYLMNWTPQVTLTNCVISANTSATGGGVYLDGGGSFTFTNCMIVGNTAFTSDGGGINLRSGATLINCTIADNSAFLLGGGLYHWTGSASVVNTILWGNSGAQIASNAPAALTITYSDVQGGWSGQGNIDCVPDFMGLGNYHLSEVSCCLDAGTALGAPDFDIDYDPRPSGLAYDIGADEGVSLTTPTVTPSEPPTATPTATPTVPSETPSPVPTLPPTETATVTATIPPTTPVPTSTPTATPSIAVSPTSSATPVQSASPTPTSTQPSPIPTTSGASLGLLLILVTLLVRRKQSTTFDR